MAKDNNFPKHRNNANLPKCFTAGSDGKKSVNAGDACSILG